MGVRMIANSDWIQVDPARLEHFLRKEALDELSGAGQLFLDFSCVPRIDVRSLEGLDELARRASDKSMKIALRGVNPDVYKVLKLARLSSRFLFLP
jgi:anti-anti-sigma regulatory factor